MKFFPKKVLIFESQRNKAGVFPYQKKPGKLYHTQAASDCFQMLFLVVANMVGKMLISVTEVFKLNTHLFLPCLVNRLSFKTVCCRLFFFF